MKTLLILLVSSLVFVQYGIAAKGGKGATKGESVTGHSITLPADLSVEASSASGALVSYTVNAVDGSGKVVSSVCSPSSGSIFPLGTTVVNCTTEGRKQHRAAGSFAVGVVDTVAPTLQLPSNVSAISSTGEPVIANYTATAQDVVSGSLPADCSPGTGTVYSVGSHTVNCTAVDNVGNQAFGNFTLNVIADIAEPPADDTPSSPAPELSLPGDITAQANDSLGIVVAYQYSYTPDNLTTSCAPVSGSLFAVGNTTVSCNGVDSESRTVAGSFVVTVLAAPTPLPELQLPADISVEASADEGIVVGYQYSYTPDNLSTSCAPVSGSLFPIGGTTVTCNGVDSESRTVSGSFLVTVLSPPVPTTSSLTLSWSAPTMREDGSPLSVAEISGYEVYLIAEISGNDKVIVISDGAAVSTAIENLTADTYHLSIGAKDSEGLLSSPSEIVSVTIGGN